MDGSIANSNKGQEVGGSVEMQRNIIMAMEILNCSICREPLRPEIYQCSCERFICKTCQSYKSPWTWRNKTCNLCLGPFSYRAYGMERVLASILVPCKYECARKTTSWYESKRHEMYCPNGPAVCPVRKWGDAACGFVAPKEALLAHMATAHKCPATSFLYGVKFDVLAAPASHLLRGEDGHIFLLTVSDSLGSGHHRAVHIGPVGRLDGEHDFGCSVSVSWESFGRTQHRSGSCDSVVRTDPTNCLCFFPRRSNLVLKTIIIRKKKNKGAGQRPAGVGRGAGRQ